MTRATASENAFAAPAAECGSVFWQVATDINEITSNKQMCCFKWTELRRNEGKDKIQKNWNALNTCKHTTSHYTRSAALHSIVDINRLKCPSPRTILLSNCLLFSSLHRFFFSLSSVILGVAKQTCKHTLTSLTSIVFRLFVFRRTYEMQITIHFSMEFPMGDAADES